MVSSIAAELLCAAKIGDCDGGPQNLASVIVSAGALVICEITRRI